LVINDEHNARTDGNYVAAYLGEGYGRKEMSRIPVLTDFRHSEADRIGAWAEKHKPDAIIISGSHSFKLVKSLNIKIPEEVGVIGFCQVPSDLDPDLTSIVEDPVHIGKVAVDFLVGMIHRGERGIPRQQQRLLVEGHWNEGNTLPCR